MIIPESLLRQRTGEVVLLAFQGPSVYSESFPRQVEKKLAGPQGKGGLEFSRKKIGQTFFLSSTFLRNYITIMYPA